MTFHWCASMEYIQMKFGACGAVQESNLIGSLITVIEIEHIHKVDGVADGKY